MSVMSNVFNGYELLLFKRFSQYREEWVEWRDKLKERDEQGVDSFGDIPRELWYLSVALHQRPRYLLQLIRDEIEQEKKHYLRITAETLLTTYINMNHFTEFHLDSIFKYGEDNTLPKEIFKCANIRFLSLKFNCLYDIPPDIGHLQKLQYLALTNNRLNVQSIPHTLTFCTSLRTLLLDNNLLDALPGFLLQMPDIETVHRHGNHNYFKSTFMWYHTDVYCRIMSLTGNAQSMPKKPFKLSIWAAKALIGSKKNFFTDENVAPVLKDYICDVYEQFKICQNCPSACLSNKPGFKVITFRNPYLGNTCVPFQHWVCSLECAKDLEIPARHEQIAKAHELDVKYERYVHDCHRSFHKCKNKRTVLSCVSRTDAEYVSDCDTVVSDSSSSSQTTTQSEFELELVPKEVASLSTVECPSVGHLNKSTLPPGNEHHQPRMNLPPGNEHHQPRMNLSPGNEHHQPRMNLSPGNEHHQPRMNLSPGNEHHQPRMNLSPGNEHHQPRMNLSPGNEHHRPRMNLSPGNEHHQPRMNLSWTCFTIVFPVIVVSAILPPNSGCNNCRATSY